MGIFTNAFVDLETRDSQKVIKRAARDVIEDAATRKFIENVVLAVLRSEQGRNSIVHALAESKVEPDLNVLLEKFRTDLRADVEQVRKATEEAFESYLISQRAHVDRRQLKVHQNFIAEMDQAIEKVSHQIRERADSISRSLQERIETHVRMVL